MMRTGANAERLEIDVVILGGGIVGAACAWALSPLLRVAVIEMEMVFGYHATGRSAALYSEYFTEKTHKCLTRGSWDFFRAPPGGFTTSLLRPRGTLVLATAEDHADGRVGRSLAVASDSELPAEVVSLDTAKSLCPILNPQGYVDAIFRPRTWDIDVEALHQGFLRGTRSLGGVLMPGSHLDHLSSDATGWVAGVTTRSGPCKLYARYLVNATGAWADDLARLAGITAIDLKPERRTIAYVEGLGPNRPPGRASWPMINDLADTFYIKPESQGLIICPCDTTPSPPCDAQPEEIDIARAVDHLHRQTSLRISRITNKWAGLRTFSPDRLPVIGAAPKNDRFFWVVGQGGAGVQTAPATGRALAALLTTGELPKDLRALGLTVADLSPGRFQTSNVTLV
jgi:D-arginine dehydrogenase